jgi:hypothetical protein
MTLPCANTAKVKANRVSRTQYVTIIANLIQSGMKF